MATSLTHTGTDTASLRRRERQHRVPARNMDLFGPSAALYKGEPSGLSNVSNVSVSDHDPILYTSRGFSIISPPGSETADVSPPTMSEDQPRRSYVSSLTRWPEIEAGAFWRAWIGVGETSLGLAESTIDFPLEGLLYGCPSADFLLEGLLYGRSSAGETQSTGAYQILAALQVTYPGAVKRIRKLASLEPDWDGYGGRPPTEEAVTAAAGLLLETHGLTQGRLDSPFIAPLPEGGLELEWDLDFGAELMLVIPPTGTDIRYLLDEPTSSSGIDESEGVVSKDATLSELISRLAQLPQ